MKNNKEPLSTQISKRKYDVPNRLFYWAYHFIARCFVIPKDKPHLTVKDDINDCKGPCFLIWNHLSRIDHLYAVCLAYPRPISIVAGYSEFFRSHLHTVFKIMNIIPKKIFANDITSMKAINRVISHGGCVCLAPEGMSSIYGVNQPIVPGTGRFIKHYRIPVYFMKMRGQYLTSTKVYLDERPGRTEAELSLLFTPEQLDAMSAEEIDNAINTVFRSDDYEWGKANRIKWKTNGRICEHLNEICYRCPRCHSELEIDSSGNSIRCRKCGNGAHMNDYYEFEPFDSNCVIPESPSKWVEWERSLVVREIRDDNDFTFTQKVKLGKLPQDHYIKHKKTSEICGEGVITVNHTGISFAGTQSGESFSFTLGWQEVYSLVIMKATDIFGLYVGGEYYEFYPEKPCVGKLLLTVEEMHRLHDNTWRNLPWYDYMYEGCKLGIDKPTESK